MSAKLQQNLVWSWVYAKKPQKRKIIYVVIAFLLAVIFSGLVGIHVEKTSALFSSSFRSTKEE